MASETNKTTETGADVAAFLGAVGHPVRRGDAAVLDAMFRRITGFSPRMWGPTIVGYGSYHYIYDSGREGDMCATGFSPRKTNLSLYIMPGYQDFGDLLARLGKHRTGAACLYINKLADVDMAVLEEIVRAGLAALNAKWPVQAT